MKKRGFGAGRWNGYGGKVEEESIEDAAKRETAEEIKIIPTKIEQKAIITFTLPAIDHLVEVHVFEIKEYEGEPKETEEMKPEWFEFDKIPYTDMWPDDEYWLPIFLEGKKFKAAFTFDKNDNVLEHEISEVDEL